jgi:glycine/D-amino acid oxidase-like deaminating enzyme
MFIAGQHQKEETGMKSDSGASNSVWMDSASTVQFPPLSQNTAVDICIVGAGIAGLSTAYELAREGRSVMVLDDGPVAGGETCRTTAHLSNAFDDRYFELERLHGLVGSRLAAESHTAAIFEIETIAQREGIACEFERLNGYLFLAPGHGGDLLDKDYEAAHRAGLTHVEKLA